MAKVIIMSESQLRLHSAVNNVLYNDFDPLGVKGLVPMDEYMEYVPPFVVMLNQNKPSEDIAQELLVLEQELTGGDGTLEGCAVVAQKLVSIRL